MEDDISIIKSLIAICGNEGLPLKNLERDYREMAEKRLNVGQYGFSCIEDLLRSCPQISLKNTQNGIVCHVNDGKISHLVDLVSRTKKPRKKARKVCHTSQRARNYANFSPRHSSRGPYFSQPSRKPLSSNHYQSNYQFKRPASPKPYRPFQDSTKPVRRDENKANNVYVSREQSQYRPSFSGSKHEAAKSSSSEFSNERIERERSSAPQATHRQNRTGSTSHYSSRSISEHSMKSSYGKNPPSRPLHTDSRYENTHPLHKDSRNENSRPLHKDSRYENRSEKNYCNQPSKSLVESDSSGWSSEDEPVNLGRPSVPSSATQVQNLHQPCRVQQPAKQETSFPKVHRIPSTNESDSDWSSDPEAFVETNSMTKNSEALSSLKQYGSPASVKTNSMTKLSETLSSLKLYGSPASLASSGYPSFKNESFQLKDSVSQHESSLVSGGVGRGKRTSMAYETLPSAGVTVTGSPSKRETFVSSLNGSQTIVVRISNESSVVGLDPQCANPSFKDPQSSNSSFKDPQSSNSSLKDPEYSGPSFQDYQFVGDFFLLEIARVCLGFDKTSGQSLCKPWSLIRECEDLVVTRKPSRKILMMVGMTDILQGSTVEKMKNEMNSLLKKLSSHKIVLMTVPIPPRLIKTEYNEALKTILQYNRWLLSLGSTHKFVDVLDAEPLLQCDKRFFKSISKSPSLSGPGVETLSEGGCWIIMDEVLTFLKNK